MHFVGSFGIMKVRQFGEPIMGMDLTTNADDMEQLQVEETDDSCKIDFIGIVPVTRHIDGSCTMECVSEDWSAEVKQENLAVVKQEPDDV